MESAEECEKLRDMVMECTNDVCGVIRVGGHRRKGAEQHIDDGTLDCK